MIWRRLKNLWMWSEYTPQKENTIYKSRSVGMSMLVKNVKKQRLATVMQDEPLEIFPEENDKTN